MDVADLLQIVRARVIAFLVRRGVLEDDGDLTLLPDDLAEREPALAQLAAAAVSGLAPAPGVASRHLDNLARLARLEAMARKWQLQEAKNRLSEVVDLALEEGPQTVTRHGKEVAVIVAKAEFDRRRRQGRPGTLLPFLRGLSFTRAGLDLERSHDLDRDVDL